jgi:hypothetical protein
MNADMFPRKNAPINSWMPYRDSLKDWSDDQDFYEEINPVLNQRF